MLESEEYPYLGRTSLTENCDLKLGSSKQGKACRAEVGWNFDVAIYLELQDVLYVTFF